MWRVCVSVIVCGVYVCGVCVVCVCVCGVCVARARVCVCVVCVCGVLCVFTVVSTGKLLLNFVGGGEPSPTFFAVKKSKESKRFLNPSFICMPTFLFIAVVSLFLPERLLTIIVKK